MRTSRGGSGDGGSSSRASQGRVACLPTAAHQQFSVPRAAHPFFRTLLANTPHRPSPPAIGQSHSSNSPLSRGGGINTRPSLRVAVHDTDHGHDDSSNRPPGSICHNRPSTARSDLRRSWVLSRPTSAAAPLTARPPPTNAALLDGTPAYLAQKRGKWREHELPPPGSAARVTTPRSDAMERRTGDRTSRSRRPSDVFDSGNYALAEMSDFEARVTASAKAREPIAGIPSLTTAPNVGNSGAGPKDYHLTRTLFHAEMLRNSTAMSTLMGISDTELADRLARLRSRFGTARLGRHDFYTWLSELAQSTKISRAESDTLFNAFDDNRSGSVDEEEFVAGLQAVLHGTHRALIGFVRAMLADVRTMIGAVMNQIEVNMLLDAIAVASRQRYPDVDDAIAVVRRSVGEFTQQAQVPASEFCRSIQVSPLVSRILAEMDEDGRLPKSPTPPPTPDPDRDIGRVWRVQPPAVAAPPAAESDLTKTASLTVEATLVRPPTKKAPAPKPVVVPVLGKLDTAHPGFKADSFINAAKVQQDVTEGVDATWFIRNSVVWCRTSMGEVPVE